MKTRFFLAQNNYIVGDIAGNAEKIIASIQQAKKDNCHYVVTSELALIGYPPRDLLFYPSLLQKALEALSHILPHTQGLTLFLGTIRENQGMGPSLFNSCSIIHDGKVIDYYDKVLLPTYDVFDEKRYFARGEEVKVIQLNGLKIAVTICEDIWALEFQKRYKKNPLEALREKKPSLLINLSSSPFELHKLYQRFQLCQTISKDLHCPVLYCNQVGANDSLVFDGYSFATDQNRLLSVAKGFEEDHLVFDLNQKTSCPIVSYLNPEQLYQALVLGIRDYFNKQGFKKALIGLSGGVDSALVAALTTQALGSQNVTAISMPSRYSSEHSVSDAKALAHNLKMTLLTMPIENIHHSYLELFQKPFEGLAEDVTEENIQSRIRGMILMACSNKWGHLVISCGNKSEMAMGYATLYGDLTGGLAAISDLTKTQVYEVAHWINRDREIIPKNILEKAPSAELRPNQKDSDTLPDYQILDQIIVEYVEKHSDASQIAAKYHLDLAFVKKIIEKIHLSEYKRRQAPIGLKITEKAFSSGWHMPIVHKHSFS